MADFAEIFKPLKTRMLRGALLGGLTGGVGGFLSGHGPQQTVNSIGIPEYSNDTHITNALKGALLGSMLGVGAGAATHKLLTQKMTQLRHLGRSMGRVQKEIERLEKTRVGAPDKIEGMNLLDRMVPNNRRIIQEIEGAPNTIAETARNEKKLRRLRRLRERQLKAKKGVKGVATLASIF